MTKQQKKTRDIKRDILLFGVDQLYVLKCKHKPKITLETFRMRKCKNTITFLIVTTF